MNNFIVCEELFSQFDNPRKIIEEVLSYEKGLNVVAKVECIDINIDLNIDDKNLEEDEDYYSIIESELFISITNEVTSKYVPSLDDLMYKKLDRSTIEIIKSRIAQHEYDIMRTGGRSFIDDLYFRLGIIK